MQGLNKSEIDGVQNHYLSYQCMLFVASVSSGFQDDLGFFTNFT